MRLEKILLFARLKRFIRRKIFVRYLIEDKRRQLSSEWKARLKYAERMKRRSTVVLILAVIALFFS